jgi:acetate---CoA ligase (ADP-forming)
MVCNHPEISEMDINPLIVHAKGNGCSVADSRIMLRKPGATAKPAASHH